MTISPHPLPAHFKRLEADPQDLAMMERFLDPDRRAALIRWSRTCRRWLVITAAVTAIVTIVIPAGLNLWRNASGLPPQPESARFLPWLIPFLYLGGVLLFNQIQNQALLLLYIDRTEARLQALEQRVQDQPETVPASPQEMFS